MVAMKQSLMLVTTTVALLTIEGALGFAVRSFVASPSTQRGDAVSAGHTNAAVPPPQPRNGSQVSTVAAARHYESEGYEIYSRSLSPRKERAQVLSELEAGQGGPISWGQRVLQYPGQVVRSAVSKRQTKTPGKLILLRCGESTFNANGTFTGWLDPDLTPRGVQQCRHAAAVLQAQGFEPDVVYTSRLQRAVKSAWVILEEMEALYLPVYKTYRLNQRMYGALQGLSKNETAAQVGPAAVHAWRNSLRARPPPLSPTDAHHPVHDRRYGDLARAQIPSTESLLDCQERARPLWEHKIRRDIAQGKTVLVVAHRDALRGLIKSIDGIGDAEIEDVRVPKCIPFVYRFRAGNHGALISIPPDPNSSLTQKYASASFLETPKSLQAAVAEQQNEVSDDLHLPGGAPANQQRPTTLGNTLQMLRAQQNLVPPTDLNGRDGNGVVEKGGAGNLGFARGDVVDDDTDDVYLATSPMAAEQVRWTDDPSEFEEYEYDEFAFDDVSDVPVNVVSAPATIGTFQGVPVGKGNPLVVLVRHGRTPHNDLGLFTGWEDPPLTEGGVEDARNAGRLLKRYVFVRVILDYSLRLCARRLTRFTSSSSREQAQL